MSEEETKTNLKPDDKGTKEKPKEKKVLISKWSVDDVCKWIQQESSIPSVIKTSIEKFRENEINGELLLKLDHEQLNEIGFSSKLNRTKFLLARDKLVVSRMSKKKIFNDDGNPEKQNEIGLLYANMNNYPEAVKWFKKAAESDYTVALVNLAHCYETGSGVEQSFKESNKYYKKAFTHLQTFVTKFQQDTSKIMDNYEEQIRHLKSINNMYTTSTLYCNPTAYDAFGGNSIIYANH